MQPKFHQGTFHTDYLAAMLQLSQTKAKVTYRRKGVKRVRYVLITSLNGVPLATQIEAERKALNA